MVEAAIAELLKSSDQDEFNFKVCRGDNCEIKTVERKIFIRYSFDVYMSKLLQNQEGPGGRVYLISSKSGQDNSIVSCSERSRILECAHLT